ncbi:MAG: hypothetical protein KME21_09170 [Desmonostoc vinosum HA7617-LM4]|jgi:hypothetical protein|nr:hypothetical protein [Desmonostoc vinosum HA7617-LM4]
MKAKIVIQDITVDSLLDIPFQDMSRIIGGYSWAEFKQDVKDFFDGVIDGFNSIN